MNRIERLNAILIHLQSKRVVKAAELADRFGISLRTVYRDIRALERAGVPIGAEAGVGYFLMDNFHLHPVSFTTPEASALLMGEKLMDKMSDHETRDFYRSAVFKIRAILKPAEKEYIESLANSISVFNWATLSPNFNKLHLSEIQQAIAREQVLEIGYQARYSGENTSRLVEPIGLCNYDSRWHLIAWCRLRSSYRDFRLDRIESLRITDEGFEKRKHISMDEYFANHSFSSAEINIRFEISPDVQKLIEESKFWYGFQGEELLPNGNFLLRFGNNDLNGFSRWLVAGGIYATSIEPAELNEMIRQRVALLNEFYGK
ncbi:helix-turn-helix transcriptional regulator [Gaoshiqia sp. Z1-71]|uniref:helix-turn-helix transcriptional regulator n=1 Tax=Gaoshiqia hydrogeniformans TaxID=3290090 RepID=UPI003BF81CB1